MQRNYVILPMLLALCGGAKAQVFTNQETVATGSYLKAIGAPQAWARGFSGKGSIIAIIDNGFALSHKDIAPNILDFRNFYQGVSLNWGLHGTEMASIAAGAANGSGTVGVAPGAGLLLAQVGSGGTTVGVNLSAMLQAMTWADSKGANVINLSLGTTYDTNFIGGTTQIAPGVYKANSAYNTSMGSQASLYGFKLGDVQSFANASKNAVIVASAGNSATGYAQFPGAFATQTDSKGNLLLGGRVLIVGNVQLDAKGNWGMNASSNAAGSLCSNIVNNICQDKFYVKDFYVVAPGSAILGAVPDEARTAAAIAAGGVNGVGGVSGTSPAAALVSGGVALIHQAWPQLRADQLVQLVLNTSTSLGDSNVYGRGMVNFDKATQPMGQLILANLTRLTGTGIVGVAVTGTGVVSSGAISLATSSVLRNTQAVDGLGRNYTVDLTQARTAYNSLSYQYASPWMAFAGGDYKQTVLPMGRTGVVTIMNGASGSAFQYEWAHDPDTRLSVELGGLTEKTTFLGNTGVGGLSFGNGATSWAGFGFQRALIGDTSLIGNYTFGMTIPGGNPSGLITMNSTAVSDSWKIGISESRILYRDHDAIDALSLSIASPVAVRKGYATVAGVVDYTYADNADGSTDAIPVQRTERVRLAPQTREMDLVLGYNIAFENQRYFGINLVHQMNVGSVAGSAANGASLMFRALF